MRAKILLFGLTLCMWYGTAWAQTSFGGFIDTDAANNAGTGGGATNSFFGYEAGLNTTGIGSTFMGYQSGYTNTTAWFNTAIGYQALYSNTTTNQNTAIGYQALYSNTTPANTAIGHQALYSNTTGYQNTATGTSTLYSNTTGYQNIANGYEALYSNTTGYQNTAHGTYALYSNTTGYQNTANGYEALYSNTIADFNTATGYRALQANTASWNTANGHRALEDNTTGFSNTGTGYRTLEGNTTGDRNTAIGVYALLSNSTGSNNTGIGYNAGPTIGSYSNTTALGYNAANTASNQVRIGNNAVSSIGGYANWSNISDGRFKKDIREDIPGLDFITQLRPISYDLDRAKISAFLGKEETEEITTSTSYKRSVGFVAQEVEQLLNENEYTPIGIETPQNEKDHYSIRYAEFVVPLVKAVQELSAENEQQKQRIETLQQELETLKEAVYSSNAKTIDSEATQPALERVILHQNAPNPFNEVTTIHAVVPEAIQQAKIVVYNLQGLELESYTLYQRGSVAVEISGGRFPSGMYIYALLADERVIDTKKMILTK